MKSREILEIQNFDPYDVDIEFLKKVSDMIPKEGYIDPAMAEKLATICLQAADKAGDLLGQATLYLSHCDGLKRSARSEAINDALERKVPSTVAKEIFAADPKYKEATSKHNSALAWHTWLESKRDTLIKTHHLCKDLVRRYEANTTTNWEPSERQNINNDSTKKTVGPTSW